MEENILLNLKTSYIFKDNINRIWNVLTHKDTFLKIFYNEIDFFKFNEGNTFVIGSEFLVKWKDLLYINIKVEEKIETENYKKFKLLTQKVFPIDIKFKVTYHLFWNSVEQTTAFIMEINCDDPETMIIYNQQYKEDERIFMCKRIEKILYEDLESLNQTESILMNLSIHKLWNIVTDWRLFKLFVPNIAEEVEYEGDPSKINTEMKIINKSKNSVNKLKVLKSEFDKNSSYAEYILECYYGVPRCPFQEISFRLVEVDTEICYVCFKHDFKQPVKYELINAISKEKKNILASLKNASGEYERFLEENNQMIYNIHINQRERSKIIEENFEIDNSCCVNMDKYIIKLEKLNKKDLNNSHASNNSNKDTSISN